MNHGNTEDGSRRRWSSYLLWALVSLGVIVSLVSLSLNALVFYRLMALRQQVVDGLDQAIAALESARIGGLHYDYQFEQTIPFSGDIPFKQDLTMPFAVDVPFQQDLTIPFEGDIPINTKVRFPINAGMLGSFSIDVPIKTTVHISTTVPIRVDRTFRVETSVPVKFDQTFHVDTSFPISLTIPLDIPADDPGFQSMISQLREWLVQLRESL